MTNIPVTFDPEKMTFSCGPYVEYGVTSAEVAADPVAVADMEKAVRERVRIILQTPDTGQFLPGATLATVKADLLTRCT